MSKLPSKIERSGVNLTQLKNKFLQLNKDNLYVTIFHYFCILLFGSLIWVYLTSNFNTLPEVHNANATDAPLFKSHQLFRILFWLGLVILLVALVTSFIQKKLGQILDLPMMIMLAAYVAAGLFMFVSQGLYSFLTLYFNNQDPFKAFSTPAQVLGELNYELYGGFLILAIALFGFSFLLKLMSKLHLRIGIVRHN